MYKIKACILTNQLLNLFFFNKTERLLLFRKLWIGKLELDVWGEVKKIQKNELGL